MGVADGYQVLSRPLEEDLQETWRSESGHVGAPNPPSPSNAKGDRARRRRHKLFYMPEGNIVIQVWRIVVQCYNDLLLRGFRFKLHCFDLVFQFCMSTLPF